MTQPGHSQPPDDPAPTHAAPLRPEQADSSRGEPGASQAHGNAAPHAHGAHHRHSAHHMLLFASRRVSRRSWFVLATAVALMLGVVIVLLLFTHVDWAAAIRVIAGLPAVPLVAAMALLPLVGFPILPVYLIAGARFGAIGGGVVVTLVTAVHLVGTYVIARTVLRGPLQRLLARWHAHLPEIPRDEEAAVALIAVLVPGLPYVIRNYLLAVAGLRLRVYFWICLPIHVARSYVSILVGHLGTAPDRHRLLILVAIELLKAVVCAAVIWWLREHHRRLHGARAGAASSPPSA